jgi:hypothetical protein
LCEFYGTDFFSKPEVKIHHLDASTVKKWSIHLVADIVFINNFHIGAVMREFRKWILKKYGEPRLINVVGEKDALFNVNPYYLWKLNYFVDGVDYKFVIDMGVYTKNRLFRPAGCCKACDEKRVFIPVTRDRNMGEVTRIRGLPVIFKPSLAEFIESLTQDPLFNKLWIEKYRNFLSAEKPGSEIVIGSISVSRKGLSKTTVRVAEVGRIQPYAPIVEQLEFDVNMFRFNEGILELGEKCATVSSPGTTCIWSGCDSRQSLKRKQNLVHDRLGKRTQIIFGETHCDRHGVVVFSTVCGGKLNYSTTSRFINTLEKLSGLTIGTSRVFENNTLIFKCLGTYCPFKRAHHQQLGVTLIVNTTTSILQQSCFHEGCKGREGTEIRPYWLLRRGITTNTTSQRIADLESKNNHISMESYRTVVGNFYNHRVKTANGETMQYVNSSKIPIGGIVYFLKVLSEIAEEDCEGEEQKEDVSLEERYMCYNRLIYEPSKAAKNVFRSEDYFSEVVDDVDDLDRRTEIRFLNEAIYGVR